MTKVDTVIDLIARALGMTTAPEIARLTGYLDLYAELVSPQAELAVTWLAGIDFSNANIDGAGVCPDLPPGTEPDHEPEVSTEPVPPEKRFNEPEDVADQRRSAFSGNGGTEKREIYNRLRAYREANGLGCFAKLEAAANKAVSAAEITKMYNAAPYPMAKWRVLEAALSERVGNENT